METKRHHTGGGGLGVLSKVSLFSLLLPLCQILHLETGAHPLRDFPNQYWLSPLVAQSSVSLADANDIGRAFSLT